MFAKIIVHNVRNYTFVSFLDRSVFGAYVGNPKECHANKPSVLSKLAIHNGSSCIVPHFLFPTPSYISI